MNIETEIFLELIYPKKGEDMADCQDARCNNLDKNWDIKRFAVADGVSSSFFPAIFSQQLTEYFCCSNDPINLQLFDKPENWKKWLVNIQGNWLAEVAHEIKQTKKYYVRNRFYANDHAGATFVGLEISRDNKGDGGYTWKAMIIGDSCLMHITNKNEFQSYLLKSSDDFNYTPKYFPSRYIVNNPYTPDFKTGKVSPNDIFFLATDAISKWILDAREKKDKNRFVKILPMGPEDILTTDDIDIYRNDKESPLENDDVAILGIKILDSNEKELIHE